MLHLHVPYTTTTTTAVILCCHFFATSISVPYKNPFAGQSIFLLNVVIVLMQCRFKNTACIGKKISTNIKCKWFVINRFKNMRHCLFNHHLTKNIIFSESDRHKDSRQQLTIQPHVCPAGSQSNRLQSGLLPAFPAPQRQSAD